MSRWTNSSNSIRFDSNAAKNQALSDLFAKFDKSSRVESVPLQKENTLMIQLLITQMHIQLDYDKKQTNQSI